MGSVVSTVKNTLFGGSGGAQQTDQDVALNNFKRSSAQHMIDIAAENNPYTPEMLGNEANTNAQFQAGQAERMANQGYEDQQRKASQEIAKRGLGNSSIGFNHLMNADTARQNKIGDIRAGLDNFMGQDATRRYGLINQDKQTRSNLFNPVLTGAAPAAAKFSEGSNGLFGQAAGIGAAYLGGGAGMALGGNLFNSLRANPTSNPASMLGPYG